MRYRRTFKANLAEYPGGKPEAYTIPYHGKSAELVALDPDHPGFRDAEYRSRRNAIALHAMDFRDGTPIPEVEYIEVEHQVWSTVWRSLSPLHDRYACKEYVACDRALGLSRERIPQLSEVNAKLSSFGTFRMLPVAGLVSAGTFLGYLQSDIFLSTQYIRHFSVPLYTPEPDIVHELVGHAATFVDPAFADLNRAFGAAVLDADEAAVERIARVYWYTLEFGAVRENGALKVFGAGLLSSFGELGRFEQETPLVPMNLDRVAETTYDPSDYQRVLFVAQDFDSMVRDLHAWLRAQH